jgi:hypothetical protein
MGLRQGVLLDRNQLAAQCRRITDLHMAQAQTAPELNAFSLLLLLLDRVTLF